MAFLSCGIGSGCAKTITIDQLREDCASPRAAGTNCLRGISDGHGARVQMGTLFTKRRKPFCIPGSIKISRSDPDVNKAATESPEMQKEPADLLWMMTLSTCLSLPKSK